MGKNLIGGLIIIGDVLFGTAAPKAIGNLHHESHAHLYGAVAVYVFLAVGTLWVIASVVRTRSAAAAAKRKPAPRTYSIYGGPR